MSTDLSKWDILWESFEGFDDEAIAATEDQGTYTKLTVRAPENQTTSADTRLFFRVKVALPSAQP